MVNSSRPALHEGAGPAPLVGLEEATGLDASHLRHLLEDRSTRLKRDLRLRAEPFVFEGLGVATTGIAGVVRLAPTVELEVVPKCFTPSNPGWRDDFLFMATVTRLGRIFRRERVSASRRKDHEDLLSLLADVFLEEFEQLVRVPIREYRRLTWTEPDIDGDLNYEEVWAPLPEGLPQSGSRLSARNPFMGTISEAAAYLGGVSMDRGVGQRLQRLAAPFRGPVPSRPPVRVPGRHAHWQELYDLARDILAGHGLHLAPGGGLHAPGFVLNTERCWEDTLALALVTRGGPLGARVKPRLRLGERRGSGVPETVFATPDLVLAPPSLTERIVVDAKYKGGSHPPIASMDRSDVYEALAFAEAADCSVAILVYPHGAGDSPAETGEVAVFDELAIGRRRVLGVTVNTRGIGRPRGLTEFGRGFGEGLLRLATGTA